MSALSSDVPDTQGKPQLKRTLNLFDFLCLGINGVIGSGIFIVPSVLAGFLGPASLLVYLFCGALCLLLSFCFAEMGGMYRSTGGAYLYAREAFGPLFGFLVGWEIWLAALLGWATVARSFLCYWEYFRPSGGASEDILVLAFLILGLGALNYVGVRPGALANDIFAISKLVPLIIFVLVGLPHTNASSFSPHLGIRWENIGSAILVGLFVFTGFEEIPVPAGEGRDPQRTSRGR